MPFCPNCQTEYNENDSAEKEPTYKDWVHLARLTSSEYAQMILEVLRSRNIPSVILSGTGHFGQTGQMGVSSFRPIGGTYSLMVPHEHIADADREAAIVLGDEWENVKLVDIDIEN